MDSMLATNLCWYLATNAIDLSSRLMQSALLLVVAADWIHPSDRVSRTNVRRHRSLNPGRLHVSASTQNSTDWLLILVRAGWRS
jgi:hypothetical protein